MGRKQRPGGLPQRPKLVSNRELRGSLESNAFSLYRELSDDSSNNLLNLLKALQADDDIPESVGLYVSGHHSTLVQERRMKKSLARGIAIGFVGAAAILKAANSLKESANSDLEFEYVGASVIGRNRNVIIAHINDKDGVLERQRKEIWQQFKSMGVKLDMDKRDHVTLGESPIGLTATESRHVSHILEETLPAIGGLLLPLMVEHRGIRQPLINPEFP